MFHAAQFTLEGLSVMGEAGGRMKILRAPEIYHSIIGSDTISR